MATPPFNIADLLGARGIWPQVQGAKMLLEAALQASGDPVRAKGLALRIVFAWQKRFEWALRSEIPDWTGFAAFRCITDYSVPLYTLSKPAPPIEVQLDPPPPPQAPLMFVDVCPAAFPQVNLKPLTVKAADCPQGIDDAEKVWRAFVQFFYLRANPQQKNMYSGKLFLLGPMIQEFAGLLPQYDPRPGGQAGNILWLWLVVGAKARTHMPMLYKAFQDAAIPIPLLKGLEFTSFERPMPGQTVSPRWRPLPQVQAGVAAPGGPRKEAPAGGSAIVAIGTRRLIYQFGSPRVLTMTDPTQMPWDRVRFFDGGRELTTTPLQREGPPQFRETDLKDPAGLAGALDSASMGVPGFLWKKCDPATQTLISTLLGMMPTTAAAGVSAAKQLASVLIEVLNTVIGGACVYDGDRFDGVSLSPLTTTMLGQNPTGGADLRRLNRLLLEDAFPSFLSPWDALAWPAFPFFCEVTIQANELIVRLADDNELSAAFAGQVHFAIMSGMDAIFYDKEWIARDRALQARLLEEMTRQLRTLARCGVRVGVELSSKPMAQYARWLQSLCREEVVVCLGINGEDELPGVVGEEALGKDLFDFWCDETRLPPLSPAVSGASMPSAPGSEYLTFCRARKLAKATGVRTLYVHTNTLDFILRRDGDPGSLLRAQQGDMMGKGFVIAALLQRAYGNDWLTELTERMPPAVKPEALECLARFVDELDAREPLTDGQKEQLLLNGLWLATSCEPYSLAVVPVMWPSLDPAAPGKGLPDKLDTTGAGDMSFGAFMFLGGV